MSSSSKPIPDYPATMPLSLEGVFAIYKKNVFDPLWNDVPDPEFWMEESFWQGAEVFLSILSRAKDLGADVKEGSELVRRLQREIAVKSLTQPTRICAAFERHGPRE